LNDLKLNNVILQPKIKEEADVCDASSDTSSLKDEYIVGMKYGSHHEPATSTENRVSSV
jgi:hypothetical protein